MFFVCCFISLTTEPIEFSISGKLHMSPEIVLGYSILRFKFIMVLGHFSVLTYPSDAEPLYAMVTATIM